MPRPQSSFTLAIQQVNQRLKAARLGLQVEQRGEKLCLRGVLPPRPGSVRLRSHQQRLSLGLPATTAGLKQAEQTAKVVAAQLIQNTFDWKLYAGPQLQGADITLTEQLAAFEADFFQQRQDRQVSLASARTTWDGAYAPYLRKLQQTVAANPQLTLVEALYATVRSTAAHSRSRQTCCTALGALVTFLDLELPISLKSFWGSYSPSRTQARELPSDAAILAAFNRIPNPAWRFVYGVMATYGLRNHEVFFCDYAHLLDPQTDSATVQVLSTTKTGSHEVWPFYPEWVDRFELRQVCLPSVTLDLNRMTLQRLGQLVTRQFRRYEVGFSPYNLRHAWAVRTIHFGLPDTVAARMMGHSVAVHNRTYHRWLTHRDQQQAVDTALSRYATPGSEN